MMDGDNENLSNELIELCTNSKKSCINDSTILTAYHKRRTEKMGESELRVAKPALVIMKPIRTKGGGTIPGIYHNRRSQLMVMGPIEVKGK